MFARLSLSALTLAAAVALPGAASAQDAFARSSTWLRAGPGTQYPSVVRVSRGEPLDVYGCLRGRSWCDVSASGDRGWMRGSAIDYVYQGRRVIITDPFAAGVAVLSFGLADYWNDHYRNRSWYRQDRYWRGPDWDRRPNRPPHVGPGPDRPPHVGPGPNRPPHVGSGPDRPPQVRPGPNRPPQVGPRPERPQMERPRPERPQVQRPRPERPQMERPRPERPQMQRPERPQMQQRPERPQMQQQRPARPQMQQPRPQGGNSGGRGPACPPGGNCR